MFGLIYETHFFTSLLSDAAGFSAVTFSTSCIYFSSKWWQTDQGVRKEGGAMLFALFTNGLSKNPVERDSDSELVLCSRRICEGKNPSNTGSRSW
jgi:hypothetical protein